MKTYKTASGLLLGAFVFILGACGGGTTLNTEEATGVMQAALTASDSASQQVQSGLGGTASAEVKVELDADHFTVHGKVTSPDGGSATVDGEGTKTADDLEVTLSISFDHWQVKEKNLVLTGELDLSTSIVKDGDATTIEASYSGDLDVSGSTNGTVSFDVTAKTKTSPTGVCVSTQGEVGGATLDSRSGC